MGTDAKPSNRLTCRLKAEARTVRRALNRIMVHFGPTLGAEDLGAVELALAEVLNNIVEHAYAGLEPGPVRVLLVRQSAALVVTVEDEGHPMPGLALPAGVMQPVADEIGALAEGGWGWALIRSLTQDLTYERAGQINRLSFAVPLTPPSA